MAITVNLRYENYHLLGDSETILPIQLLADEMGKMFS